MAMARDKLHCKVGGCCGLVRMEPLNHSLRRNFATVNSRRKRRKSQLTPSGIIIGKLVEDLSRVLEDSCLFQKSNHLKCRYQWQDVRVGYNWEAYTGRSTLPFLLIVFCIIVCQNQECECLKPMRTACQTRTFSSSSSSSGLRIQEWTHVAIHTTPNPSGLQQHRILWQDLDSEIWSNKRGQCETIVASRYHRIELHYISDKDKASPQISIKEWGQREDQRCRWKSIWMPLWRGNGESEPEQARVGLHLELLT